MKTIATFLSMLTVVTVMTAQSLTSLPDTLETTRQLNEVVVEAQMQHTSATVTTYYPDRNTKRTAQNAIELLDRMAIPQISINPVAGSVETPGGESVSIYIDMEQASQEEMDALRPEDVKKVEYLAFPTDPRYNHDKYVINITLNHYEYGGYAKISGTGNVMAGSGSGLAYTKMSYRRMTYDLNVTDKYSDRHNSGTEQTQVFRFPRNNDVVDEITRSNLLDYGRFRQNQLGASLRAKYTSDKAMISNTVSFAVKRTPNNDSRGSLIFSNVNFENQTYSNSSNSTYIYPRWKGSYFFNLDKGFKLNILPSVLYQYTKSHRKYESKETSIMTDAIEKAVTAKLQCQLNKSFSKYHTVDINLLGIYYYNKVDYTGNTVASPVFNQFAYGGMLGYSFNKDRFYGQFIGAIAGESNEISGVRVNSIIPVFNLNVQYAINNKNSIVVTSYYNVNPVEAADKTPNYIQENELLYKTGNLYLKNTPLSSASIDYTWLPNNIFSISANSGWFQRFNRIVPVFTTDGPDGLMLRSLENNGDYQEFYVGTSLSAKLLKRSLVFKVAPRMCFEKTTGLYTDRANYLSLSLSATYYLDKFYFSAYYSTASRNLVEYSLNETSIKRKPYYRIKAGWSNGRWNLSASAVNIFRRNWVESTSSLKSVWFDQFTTEYGASSHRYVGITASYTFGFGKKVKRGDEIQTSDEGGSAIMK